MSEPVRTRAGPSIAVEIPIIGSNRRIVGWTTTPPKYSSSNAEHAEAEKITGGPVAAAYVQIDDPADAQRAGAPRGWKDPWRCIAICSEQIVGVDGTWRGRLAASPKLAAPPRGGAPARGNY
jgi:hypothetical protein